ncbi:MAG: Rpn family recombination-promoting nuclease/putative transposase [Acetatifactor sp.]|nr:Rpn family recombination-promoting nuclease/putative transposase [Acetatifactor sp.]
MKFESLKSDYVFKEVISEEYVRKQFISDVLKIPMEEIKEVRITNSFLRRTREKQKEGILDIALLMNDDTKMDIELQVRPQKYWVRRSLFYIAKLFAEDLKKGYDYNKLKKCISISILDFNLLENERNHSIFRLCDEQGVVFTDLLEFHVIELRKKLGNDALDDWIRLFNAKRIEDLDMIKTQNKGIQRAMEMMREMSLSRYLKALSEDKEKRRRDRWAEDQYVYDQGVEQGIEQGIEQGWLESLIAQVCRKLKKGKLPELIAEELEEDITQIQKICETAEQFAPDYDVKAIYEAIRK